MCYGPQKVESSVYPVSHRWSAPANGVSANPIGRIVEVALLQSAAVKNVLLREALAARTIACSNTGNRQTIAGGFPGYAGARVLAGQQRRGTGFVMSCCW